MNDTVRHSIPSMGGTLNVAVTSTCAQRSEAEQACRQAAARLNAWARHLTRFDDGSDLSRLNEDPASSVAISPTLAAAMHWAQQAGSRTNGVVDVTLLDARLAAESGGLSTQACGHSWRLVSSSPRSSVVQRRPGVRFDLDGVAKGWLADRALELLQRWPAAVVDADGDIAVSMSAGAEWLVEIEDPNAAAPIATLRLAAESPFAVSYGVATSGTSVHRWRHKDAHAHHLIDATTGRPAETDVVQATVVAPSAREAEILAKAVVILGAERGFDFLTRSTALAAIALLVDGDVVALEGVERWLV